jgi:cell division protein FtsN
VRRTVATLLVVASPLLTAVPVGASEPRPAGPAVLPATPAVVQAPAVPAPVTVAPPATPAVLEAPAVAAPAPAAVTATAAARPAVKAVRAKARNVAAVGDAAYAARLQAELCRARQIFCGLDEGGRYPAG